jgi:hypothetical protein
MNTGKRYTKKKLQWAGRPPTVLEDEILVFQNASQNGSLSMSCDLAGWSCSMPGAGRGRFAGL